MMLPHQKHTAFDDVLLLHQVSDDADGDTVIAVRYN